MLSHTLKIPIASTSETQMARFSEQFRPAITPQRNGEWAKTKTCFGLGMSEHTAGGTWGRHATGFVANSWAKRRQQPPRQSPFPSSRWTPWKLTAEHLTNSTPCREAHKTIFELNDKIWKTFDQSSKTDIQKAKLNKSDPRAPPAEEANKNLIRCVNMLSKRSRPISDSNGFIHTSLPSPFYPDTPISQLPT